MPGRPLYKVVLFVPQNRKSHVQWLSSNSSFSSSNSFPQTYRPTLFSMTLSARNVNKHKTSLTGYTKKNHLVTV